MPKRKRDKQPAGRQPATFQFTYADYAELCGWTEAQIRRYVADGQLDPGSLESVLAIAMRHGNNPRVLAMGAAPAVRALLAVDGRSAVANERLGQLAHEEIIREVFEDDARRRRSVAKKKGKRT